MANVVQSMIYTALGDGARSSKFECFIGLETFEFGAGSKTISAMAKSSAFPSKSHDVIDFKFKGRSIPLRGQVKYDQTWTCSFYMDESHTLRNAINNAIEALDEIHNYGDVNSTVARQQVFNSSRYTNTMTIIQLDFDASQTMAIYTLYNAFPKNMSQVDTDYSEIGKIQEFSVEFSYSHFDMETVKGPDGSFIDKTKERLLGAVEGLVQKGKEVATDAIADLIGSAKDYVMENGGTKSGSAIEDGIDSSLLSLEQIDFNPSKMLP